MLSLTTLTTFLVVSSSSLSTPYSYMHYKTSVALEVDMTMFVVFDDGGSPLIPEFARDDVDAYAPSTVYGWMYVKYPADARTMEQQEQLIDALLESEEYDFVSPVFTGSGDLPYIPTRDLLVKRSNHTNIKRVERILNNHGTIIASDFSGLQGLYLVQTNLHDGREVLALANDLAIMDMFEYAESDAIAWMKTQYIPNDPEFGAQWGLNQASDHDMDLPEAWDISFGSEDIVVVVLDSGIDQSHPDIHQLSGETFTGASSNGEPSNDCDNHGTAVAGCIAATIDNNQGVVGVAPHCWVRAGKIFNEISIFGFCFGFLEFQESWGVEGITWAANEGARVTNSSWGGGSALSAISNAFNTTRAAGVLHVGAAGNDGTANIGWPANLSSVIAVSAMAQDGTLASFSTFGNGLFISAPGQGIRTTDRSGSDGYSSGNTTTIDGTSFSSPYTAGIAALVLSVDATLSPDGLEDVLANTAVDYGQVGYDTTFGHGFINAQAALESIDTTEPCLGDVDGDGVVGVTDLLMIVDQWGVCNGCPADINGDNLVNVSDMLSVIDSWGLCE